MKQRVILLGPPGCGKGTVAAQLKAKGGLEHVCSGHFLRQEAQAGSALGQQAANYLENGDLVPDETVLPVMERWLRTITPASRFTLDGFPRTVNQARILDRWLSDRPLPIQAVVLYDGDKAMILARMLGRRSCPQCGRVYHLTQMPPRRAGYCDDCGRELVQRQDDTEGVMRKRFEIYDRETAPLQSYYAGQGKLTLVDRGASAEQRFAATWAALG